MTDPLEACEGKIIRKSLRKIKCPDGIAQLPANGGCRKLRLAGGGRRIVDIDFDTDTNTDTQETSFIRTASSGQASIQSQHPMHMS